MAQSARGARRNNTTAADGGSSGGTAVAVPEVKVEVVDGHTIGAEATPAEVAIVEKAEGYEADALNNAIKAGQVRATWSRVEVSAKKSPTGKGGKKSYIRLEALNARGMSAICKGVMDPAPVRTEGQPKPQTGACDYFNYGSDLDRKAPVRASLMGLLEGPEKAVKKTVLGLLAAEMSPEEIRTFLHSAKKFKGVEGLDKLIDSALAA
jgi:hypothetical protein